MANVNQVDRAEGKRKPRRATYLLVGLMVLITVGGFGCKRSSTADNEFGRDSHSPPIRGTLHLEAFVVNLADSEDNRFLRVGIDLGLGYPLPAKEGKAGEGEVPTARIRDCILAVVSTWHSDALLAPEGKRKLKDELVHALQERVPELGVREVYFTDFLVQR